MKKLSQQFNMKKSHFLFQLFICISIGSFCQVSNKNTVTKKDTTTENAPAPPKDRNMFGIGIPRGLTISSDGLTEGYVMYAVCNSASVYLINRKGEVVHEWKGNSGVLGAYLNDDGSLIQNAKDLDYPVFTDPEKQEDYKKLHGTVKCCGILNMPMKNLIFIMILQLCPTGMCLR